MNKISNIRQLFVKQNGHHDCGAACLSMILNYAGRGYEIPVFLHDYAHITNWTLYDLKYCAIRLGMESKCVEMDFEFLSSHNRPLILHMMNEDGQHHYCVCFGSRRKKGNLEYLIADPSSHVSYWEKAVLNEFWVSKAAIYFQDLPAAPIETASLNYLSLINWNLVPAGLWFSIPLINVAAIVCGIAMTWTLQRGFNEPFAGKSSSYLIALPILLFIIGSFKGVFNSLRHAVLISINFRISKDFVFRLIDDVFRAVKPGVTVKTPERLALNIRDSRKIQNGISTFLAIILTDGSFLLLSTILLAFFFPFAGLMALLYILTLTILAIRSYPGIAYEQALSREMFGRAENKTLKDFNNDSLTDSEQLDEAVASNKAFHTRYLKTEKGIAMQALKLNLAMEFWGNCVVTTVFIFGLLKLEKTMDYPTFTISVVFVFLITSLFPRLVSAYFVVADAIDTVRQYKLNYPC